MFHTVKDYLASGELRLAALFFLWLAISIFWSPFQLIAIYRLFIILSILIFVLIIHNLARKGLIKAEILYLSLIMGGIFQSLIGICQFILNRSLGLKILGESLLGPNLPGVAKIIVSGVKHIRAYGTFPHPNILAGFLVIPIILLVSILLKRFGRGKSNSHNVSHEAILSKIPTWLLLAFLAINLGCFLLTFSRSAFLSLALVPLILLIINLVQQNKRIWLFALVAFFVMLFHVFFIVSRDHSHFIFSTHSLEERNRYLDVSRETITKHPLLGVGLGQFVFQEIVSHPDWAGWQYQPVHNIYLLITSELGIVGLMLFLLFLLTYLYNYCLMRNTPVLLTNNLFCIILLSFLFISFLDHYFWDLKSGMIIFAVPFILHIANCADVAKTAK